MKTGFVAILGRPNVGKSTLLNALLSKRISIVSPKAQTTRDSICGIVNGKDYQIVFVDTPGIFQGEAGLDSYMRKSAYSSSKDVEAILYIIDASVASLETDRKIIDGIRSEAPKIFVLNKIDLIKAERALELIDEIKTAYPDSLLLQSSLLENFGIKEIKDAIMPYLNEGLPFFPEGIITDKNKEYQAKEIIRSKMLHFLKQEVPHQSAVIITKFKEKNGVYEINAKIIVGKKNHLAIVIGRGGEMIKKISMASRHDLESDWHAKISSLRIDVEVKEGWRDNLSDLKDLGYAN